jgi:hypothetical protein
MPNINLSDEEHAALGAYVLDKLREEKLPPCAASKPCEVGPQARSLS